MPARLPGFAHYRPETDTGKRSFTCQEKTENLGG